MSMKTPAIHWIAVIAMCVMGGCTIKPGEPPVRASTQDSVAFIARTLEECPSWESLGVFDIQEQDKITQTYLMLAQYDTSTLRAGIASYLKRYASPPRAEYFAASEKVFVFLRVLFDVPPRFFSQEHPFPFSLHGNPYHADGVDLLWPFSLDRHGKLQLTGIALSGSSGPPYDALADFDAMAARLKRRFPVSR
jgi:hypothetical protein